MIYGIYASKDKLVGSYNIPNAVINDDVAKRSFIIAAGKAPQKNDLELYKIGEFNDSTGELIRKEPELLVKGDAIDVSN